MRIYRHPADRVPSLFVLGAFAVQLATFFLVDSLFLVALVAIALMLFSAVPGAVAHNHNHRPVFLRDGLNRGYDVLLFLETGILPYAWTIHHNLGHHKLYLDQSQDPAPWRHADGRVMSRLWYDITGALRIYPEVFRIGRRYPELMRRFRRWAVISLAVLGVFVLLDPVKAFILFIAPMPFMYLGLLDNTYMQHADLDLSSEFTASRNTTSRFYNLVSGNLGYHAVHHIKPNVHWSELPAWHEKLKAQIPADLQCGSVLLSTCSYRHSRDGVPPVDTRPVDPVRELAQVLPVPEIPLAARPAALARAD